MLKNFRSWVLSLIFVVTSLAPAAYSDCISLTKGFVALDVNSCGVLKPELSFDTSNERFSFIKELPPVEQKRFWHSYKGMIVKGLISRSKASKSGLVREKGALLGEVISTFVHPQSTKYGCSDLKGKRIKAYLAEACCEGGGDAPCLLASAYTLNKIKVIGKAGTKSTQHRSTVKKSRVYLKAEKFFLQNKCKSSIKLYQRAWDSGEMDIRGLYRLAVCYRREDRCQKALRPLEEIDRRVEKKNYWSTEENEIRRGRFLLARCYAKLNKPGFSTTILQGYLLDSRKYKVELKNSLTHRDFGWIHTSKEYRLYKKEVEKKLGR